MATTYLGTDADFERVAGAITQRAAEVLPGRIWVTDDHGRVVARSDKAIAAGIDDFDAPGCGAMSIRAPLQLDMRVGEVVMLPDADVEPASQRMARALLDLVIDQVAVVDRLPSQTDVKNRFIYDLLHGEAGHGASVLRDARLLGMNLTPPRAVILIDAAGFIHGPEPATDFSSVAERRRSRQIIDSVVGFFELPDDTICAWNGDGEIAVLKASDSKNLESWVDRDDDPEPPSASWANLTALKRAGRALLARLRRDTCADVSIGIGRYHPGIRGLCRSYEDARAALSLGLRFHGANRVHCLDGLGVAAFVGLADERTKVGLARHLLSPLDHEPDLIETLRVFFDESCAASPAAQALAIHRNTLGYRLDKIATMTGLDPRRFDDAVQIRLALVLRSLGDAGG
ncbi:MAG TPA: helix-turn-helix domain-containing protein [Thermomicrobiales bacterium]|nr:helix-turn-helix domain-containing protein [Thermomicrobiales bacterium]